MAEETHGLIIEQIGTIRRTVYLEVPGKTKEEAIGTASKFLLEHRNAMADWYDTRLENEEVTWVGPLVVDALDAAEARDVGGLGGGIRHALSIPGIHLRSRPPIGGSSA